MLKRYLAWLLLLVLSVQQVAGRVYVSVVRSIEVDARMDVAEQAIADKIQAETGLDVQVAVRHEAEVEGLRQLGYAAPYVFSKEIDGKTHYFTFEQDSSEQLTYTYVINGQPDEQDSPLSKAGLERLLTNFYSAGAGLYPEAVDFTLHTVIFALTDLQDLSFRAVPAPPPRAV